MAKINMDKHVWEGWTVGMFIEDLEPSLDIIQSGQSWRKPIETKAEMKKWCMENQPYYKKYVAGVVNYFCDKYDIRG